MGGGARAVHPTLRRLSLHKGFDEEVGGLGVEGQGVAQRLQVRALLQECLLQPHAASMEVLLEGGNSRRVLSGSAGDPLVPKPPPLPPRVCASRLELPGTPLCSPSSP